MNLAYSSLFVKRIHQDNPCINVFLTDKSEEIISSEMIEEQKEYPNREMVQVENMGQLGGGSIKAVSVKSMAQEDMESEELKLIKEKQKKRKSNFAKKLAESEARRAVYKQR